MTTASLTAQNQALYNGRYPHLTEKFHQLRELSNQIIHLTFSANQTQNFDNYQTLLAQLQAQYDNLQKQIAAQVPEIQISEQIPNRHTVASALPPNSVLIEFVRFDTFNFQAIRAKGETQWESYRYLAFILPAQQPDALQMVDLGETEKIDELIGKFRLQASDGEQTLGWRKSVSSKSQIKLQIKQYNPSDAIELSTLLLAPILAKVPNYKNLIIAADGNLNLVPFQILPIDDKGKHLLMDEYTVSYLGVGRDILRSQIEATGVGDAPLRRQEDEGRRQEGIPINK